MKTAHCPARYVHVKQIFPKVSQVCKLDNLYEAMSTFPVVHRFRIVHRCCGVLFQNILRAAFVRHENEDDS